MQQKAHRLAFQTGPGWPDTGASLSKDQNDWGRTLYWHTAYYEMNDIFDSSRHPGRLSKTSIGTEFLRVITAGFMNLLSFGFMWRPVCIQGKHCYLQYLTAVRVVAFRE